MSPEGTALEKPVVVPTAAGGLSGVLRRRGDRPSPGVVLVDGSGPGSKDEWGGWPEWIGDCGAVVLRHDKPGCDGSPGDWRDQDFEDRAEESLSAARALRSVDGVSCVGLCGISQGGWVSLFAAARDPEAVDFVITISGPGVDARRAGADTHRPRPGRTWHRRHGRRRGARVDRRAYPATARRRGCGVDPRGPGSAERREWYEDVIFGAYEDAGVLRFGARIMDFDPLPSARALRCPALVLFGGADDVVPVARSVELLAGALPNLDDGLSGIADFPRGNHGLLTADPDPDVPRRDQLAAGFLPMLEAFLAGVDPHRSGSG